MRRAFLTAEWRNLILANFAVPEELLRPHLPPGCEFDRRDGACWASLVAFQFLNTRVLGISWPGFRNFPEWNLRFYVRRGEERGVCFVREFVPQWTVATIARVLYNEPYRAARMAMDVRDEPTGTRAEYRVRWGGREHTMRAESTAPPVRPAADSLEHWFKEHEHGFGTGRRGGLIRYGVEHPEWDVWPLRDLHIDIDWATLYGPEWAPMNGTAPASAVFAVGSAVRVSPRA
jgi:uncharacterized protein YqjF (DUF2071 family)